MVDRQGLDSTTLYTPHRRMLRRSPLKSSGPLLALASGLFWAVAVLPALASEPKPAPEPPSKPKPSRPSSLTGNAVPKCEAGTYPAGNICKPAAPGFYAPSGTTYPVACPGELTSKSGSRSQSECFPEGGAPAPPPEEKKKGGH